MSDACAACRKLYNNLRLEGNDVELGCEWCSAQSADSIQMGLLDADGHETILSVDVDLDDLEAGDADGMR